MVTIIVVAAGRGTRFGKDVPKQFCLLEERPVLMHTIESLRRAMPDAEILLVLSADNVDMWRGMCDDAGFESPRIVLGGSTRWESVSHAVNELGHMSDDDIVMVHDGARPFPTVTLIGQLAAAFDDDDVDGAVPVVPVTDSLRRVVDGGPSSVAVDRAELRAVQTPQAFRASKLVQAYRHPYKPTFTDDASVMESAGFTNLVLTNGDPANIKITNPIDFDIAKAIISRK